MRLGITLIDEDGTIHGPCPKCKRDVVVGKGEIAKAEQPSPGIGVRLRRRVVVVDR